MSSTRNKKAGSGSRQGSCSGASVEGPGISVGGPTMRYAFLMATARVFER